MRPADACATKVHTEHLNHACVSDRIFHRTVSGVVGPIEAKLLEFGMLGVNHTHEVLGLVAVFYEVANAIVRVRAL